MPILEDAQNTRENLNPPDDTQNLILKRDKTNINLEEYPRVNDEQLIGNHFTLDHPTNGDIDSAVYELDTGLGAFTSRYQVFNVNNSFKWDFRHAEFTDTGNSTATEDVSTNYRINFTTGQVWQSHEIYKNDASSGVTVLSATLVGLDMTGLLNISLSADDGTTWVSVGVGDTVYFSGTGDLFDIGKFDEAIFGLSAGGNTLIIKATEIDGSTATLNYINVTYQLSA